MVLWPTIFIPPIYSLPDPLSHGLSHLLLYNHQRSLASGAAKTLTYTIHSFFNYLSIMLSCAHSPSSSAAETFSLVAGNINTDMSVLERQRAVLQRMYHEHDQNQHEQSSSQDIHSMHLYQYQNLMDPMNIHNQSLDENSPHFGFACSEITSNNTSLDMDHHQRSFSTVSATNSSKDHHHVASKKKRKSEFDAEEECKAKRFEEAGEVQSQVTVKSEKENSGKTSKENSKASDLVQKTDYIHVRARRGQATDNHSLAERARREKISMKMKCLQDLVPGCNKVTGKAGMLDEIINYVQSLQKQVEFLSMKLAALNPRLELNTDHFFAKELPAYLASFSTAATPFPLELIQSAYHQYNQGPHPQGSNSCSVDTSSNPTPTQMVPQKSGTSSISFPEVYLDSISSLQQIQQLSTWDSDWQSLYNFNFH